MTWQTGLAGFAAGLLISLVTAPVGVSGAVFLLPVQLSLLDVPSPAVTPTNLLYNVVAGPGALARYRRAGALTGPLTRLLLAGTLPGVVLGAWVRVFAIPGPRVFRLVVAVVLLPLGVWLVARAARPGIPDRAPLSRRTTAGLGVAVGVVGGIYGIGGGSLLGPLLAGRGTPMSAIAPAALACTFVTSIAGAVTYGLLALGTDGDIAPHWLLGLLCGAGGLIGGYNTDVGQRMNENGTSWDWGSGGWSIETRNRDQLRRDGADTATLSVDAGQPHILTLYHDRDNWAMPKEWNPTARTYDATLIPAIGKYYKWEGRNFDGDYCEILCFDRILNESETRIVENYLAEKWLGQAVHEEIDRGGHLSAGTTLRVAAGATLDLNGCSVTVSGLEGTGTITNSSAVAATVTVTGPAAFSGVVGGPVTLRVSGESTVGARFDAGAALAVSGGNVTAGKHVLTPPTDGLAYWCDAGRRDTILCNESGSVTGWLSRVESSAKGLFNAGDVTRKKRRRQPASQFWPPCSSRMGCGSR